MGSVGDFLETNEGFDHCSFEIIPFLRVRVAENQQTTLTLGCSILGDGHS